MGERQRIPEGLAEMPPGPDLCAVLDAIDPRCLSGPDCVAVLRARARQVVHEQARFLAVMVQVGLCDPDGDGEGVARLEEPPEWAADEIRAALVWTRRAAESRFWSAHDLMTRLPAVHRALDGGRVDQPRARVFAEWTEQLTIEQARWICDMLVPIAAELTTGQLIARIKQMAIAIDPQWAERKYTEAVKTRRVVGSRNPDGTANVSGLDLPVDQAAAACARIDLLERDASDAGEAMPASRPAESVPGQPKSPQPAGEPSTAAPREEARDRRFPPAGLRRKVRARDRTCQFPGCRMPAGSTDTDHTRQWQDHGRTLEHNLASLCRHDHRIKDEGGWRLTRTPSGLLQWISPLGQSYETRPPPVIIPLPDPRPRPQHPPSAWSLASDRAEADTPIWCEAGIESPPDQDDSRPNPPRPDPADGRPPF